MKSPGELVISECTACKKQDFKQPFFFKISQKAVDHVRKSSIVWRWLECLIQSCRDMFICMLV